MKNRLIIATALLSMVWSMPARASLSTWIEVGQRPIGSRSDHFMVYDDLHQQILLAGGDFDDGNRIWTFDGSIWRSKEALGAPSFLSLPAAAFDSSVGKLVVFGGSDLGSGASSNQTWTYDGNRWENATDSIDAPPSRYGAAMAYDPLRKQVVLFGGSNGQVGFLADTWIWDGSLWTPRPVPGPTPRFGAQMAWDPALGKVVLFGGQVGAAMFYSGLAYNDTWAWDGLTWQPIVTSHSPPGRFWGGMSFDVARNQMVLFGGDNQLVPSAQTWTFDGIDWVKQDTAVTPTPREAFAMAYDAKSKETLVQGGFAYGFPPDTWAWNGKQWDPKPDLVPPPRTAGAAALVKGSPVIFGGFNDAEFQLNDTWSLSGDRWTGAVGSSVPAARSAHMFATDPNGNGVLYGGWNGRTLLHDTWTFDGVSWTRQHPATSPPPLNWTSMSLDQLHGQDVMFGGANPYPTNDTWLWDGSNWTQALPNDSPSIRWGNAIGYDQADHVTLMFGGAGVDSSNNVSLLGDLWSWDGSDWTQLSLGRDGPVPRVNARFATDPSSGRLVLFGGTVQTCSSPLAPVLSQDCYDTPANDAWIWEGSSWQRLPDAPRFLDWPSMTSDPSTGSVVIEGGTEWFTRGETFRLQSDPYFAAATRQPDASLPVDVASISKNIKRTWSMAGFARIP